MAYWNKKEGKWTQNPKMTQVNVYKETKEKLKAAIIEESIKSDSRVSMNTLIEKMLELYKNNEENENN